MKEGIKTHKDFIGGRPGSFHRVRKVYVAGLFKGPPHIERLSAMGDELVYWLLENGVMEHVEGLNFRDLFMPFPEKATRAEWGYEPMSGELHELLRLARTLGINEETAALFYEAYRK